MSEAAMDRAFQDRDADKEKLVATASADPTAGRLASLDVFRGLTVAGMILANNMGRPSYAPFHHAAWNGWTPTDLIFPSFLFIVGVSITFALTKRRAASAGVGPVVGKILRRGAIIFGLGLLLAEFPRVIDGVTWDKVRDGLLWNHLRIPGVLQRIALCYLVAALIFLGTRVSGQVIATVALLVGYFVVMKLVPAPGFLAGDWEQGHDIGSYLDRLLLDGHLYRPDYDPEGLLSTLPAIATTLLGALAGHWLRSGRERPALCSGLFVAGTFGVILGASWDAWFPINKALWTSSFVLLAGGWSSIGLATCFWLVDVQGDRRWAAPLRVLGTNPIVAYCLAAVGAQLLNRQYLQFEGHPASVHQLYNSQYLNPYLWPEVVTLVYAATLLLVCILVVAVLDLLHLHVRA